MNTQHKTYTLNLNNRLKTVENPLIMGILNITPDSFYAGSRWNNDTEILQRAEKMLHDGVDIIDIGGQSARPGAAQISEQEEIERVIPAINSILKKFPSAVISVDTFSGKVAYEAVDAGAAIINDISAGSMDKTMFETVAKLGVPYIIMHMQGVPKTMQLNPCYENVVGEIVYFFSQKLNTLRQMGVKDIIIDPGFAFGKKQEHNIALMQNLQAFSIFNVPVLVGISRKTMVQRMVNSDAEGALNGTTALNTIALINGAQILRVHDVKEAVEAVSVYKAIYQA